MSGGCHLRRSPLFNCWACHFLRGNEEQAQKKYTIARFVRFRFDRSFLDFEKKVLEKLSGRRTEPDSIRCGCREGCNRCCQKAWTCRMKFGTCCVQRPTHEAAGGNRLNYFLRC